MVYPFNKTNRKKTLLLVLTLLMVVCTGFYLIRMESNEIINNICSSNTTILNSRNTVLGFFVALICFECLLPSAIMLWFYYKIAAKVKCFHNISKRLNQDQNQEHHLQNYQRKKVALKTLRILIIMYMLFVFPGRLFGFSCVFIFFDAPSVFRQSVFIIAVYFMDIFLYLNNVCNVFVYTWHIVGFRRFLKKFLTFGLLEKRKVQNPKHQSVINEAYTMS